MNKKLLSIAVAASIVAPMVASADATLYGRLRNSVTYNDYQDPVNADGTDATGGDPEEQWDVESQSSRLGVKGSEDLGNGLKAIYQIELEMNTSENGSTSRPRDGVDTFGTRLGYVGLQGDWGTVAIGRQWTPYYGSVDKFDVYDVGGFNDTYIGLTRIGDTLAYISPSWSGFSGKLALIMSDESGTFAGSGGNDVDSDNIDAWNASIDYDNGPFEIGLSYLKLNGEDDPGFDADYWQAGGAIKYTFRNMFALIGSYEYQEGNDENGSSNEEDRKAGTIMGEYYFGNNTLRAHWGRIDDDNIEKKDYQWAIGLKHNFSKRTSVHIEYEDSEINTRYNANDDGITRYDEHQRFGIGLRHDF